MAFQDVGLRLTILGVSQFQRNVVAVDRSMSNLNRSLGSMGGPLKSISRNLDALGTTFISVGRMLTIGLTLPLAALTTGLVAAGISFEDAFSGVSKTVEGVADDFGKLTPLGEKIRKDLIALSLELPISVNELARIAQAAGQVGVSAENLLEFTTIAAKMGVATNIASDQAAISLARLGNILGVSGNEFISWSERTASAIVMLGNNVAATESEIVSMALRIAPMGGVIGLTTQEILGLSAALAEVGVRSQRGGTAVSRIFLEMSQAASGGTAVNAEFEASLVSMQPELQQLRNLLNSGVTDFNELKFALRDTNLDLSGLSTLLNDLGKPSGSLASLNATMQKQQITIEGYNRDLSALQTELAGVNRQYDEGTITLEEHAAATNRLLPRIADMEDTISKAAITTGEYNRRLGELNANVVSIDDVIKHVSQNTLMEFEKAMGEGSSKIATFARVMGVSKEEFAAAFGAKPLETFQRFLVEVSRLQEEGKISEEVLAELGLAGMRVLEVVNILGPNMELLTDNVAMANDEWIKHTALQVEVQKKFATTKAQITLLKNNVVALGIALFDNLKPAIDGTIKSLIGLVAEFKDLLFGPIDKLPKTVDGVATSVYDLGGAIALIERRRFITNFRKNFKRLFIVAIALGPALTVVGLAFKALAFVFSGLSNVLGKVVPVLRLLFLGIFTNPVLLAAILGIGAAIAGLYIAFKTNFLGIADLVRDLLDSFNQFSNAGLNIKNAFKDLLSGDIDGAVHNLKLAWEDFVFWFEQFAIPIIKSWASKAWPELKRLAKVFVDWIVDVVPKVLDELGKLLVSIVDWMAFIALPWLGDQINKWVPLFVDWVIEIWPELTKKLGTLLETIVQWIIDVAPGILAKLWEWTKAFFEWVIDVGPQLVINLAALLAYLTGWVFGVGISLDTKLHNEWLPALYEWAKEVWPKLEEELIILWGSFTEWIETTAKDDIVAALESIGNAVWEVGKELGKLFIDGFSDATGFPLADILKILGDAEDFWNTTLGGGIQLKQKPIGDRQQSNLQNEVEQLNSNQAIMDSLKGFFGNSPSLNLSGTLGGTISGNTTNSSVSTSSVFAPSITGVPMTSEESIEQALLNAFRMAQVAGYG